MYKDCTKERIALFTYHLLINHPKQFSIAQLRMIAEKRFGYQPPRHTILDDLAAISIAIGVDYVVGEYNKKLYYWTPLNEEAEQALKEREENDKQKRPDR